MFFVSTFCEFRFEAEEQHFINSGLQINQRANGILLLDL